MSFDLLAECASLTDLVIHGRNRDNPRRRVHSNPRISAPFVQRDRRSAIQSSLVILKAGGLRVPTFRTMCTLEQWRRQAESQGQ